MAIDLQTTPADRTAIRLLSRIRCRAAWHETGDFVRDNVAAAAAPLPEPTSVYFSHVILPETRVEAAASPEGLLVRFISALRDPALLEPPTPSAKLTETEHVALELRPANDTGRAVRFAGDWRGQVEVVALTTISGECSLESVVDRFSKSEAFKGDWHYYHALHRDHWLAEFVIPWASLSLAAPPAVIGIAYQRSYTTGEKWPALNAMHFPPILRAADVVGTFDHAELLVTPEAAAPAALSLATPRFGLNHATLQLGNAAGKCDRMVVRTTYKDETISEKSYDIDASALEIDVPFELFRSHDKHTDRYNAQRFRIELLKGDTQVYNVAFPAGRHRGLCIDEPYGEPRDEAAEAAYKKMSAADRWRDDVIRKLPRLHRRDTNAGAPSDFCLYDGEGNLVCNMMTYEAWDQLAKVITDRFDTLHDQLVAAMCLIGQKSVTNLILEPLFFNAEGKHTYHTPLHEVLGPMSIIRYGGGSATCRAIVLAKLCERFGFESSYGMIVPPAGVTPRCEQDLTKDRGTAGYLPQQPGPMSFVGVGDYGQDMLFDPTTLGFVAVDCEDEARGYRMADVRRLELDELATVFFGPDADAVQPLLAAQDRWYANHATASHGVFPELAPEELLKDEQPMSIGFAHCPLTIRAGEGNWSDPSPTFSSMGAWSQKPDAMLAEKLVLRVRHDSQGLEVAIESTREEMWLRPEDLLVHLMIDAAHGHERFSNFTFSLSGAKYAHIEQVTAMQTLNKHLATEQWNRIAPIENDAWDVQGHVLDSQGARGAHAAFGKGLFTFRISWQALDLDAANLPATIGLNACLDFVTSRSLLSPPRHRLPADPMSFADLYLNDPAVVVKAIDFGVPVWGDNSVKVTLENVADKDANVTLSFNSISGMQRATRAGRSIDVKVPAGGTINIDAPCWINPAEKMCTVPQKIELLVTDAASSKTQYQSTWIANYTSGLNVYPGGYDLKPDDAPHPGLIDPHASFDERADYLQRRLRYITARLPDLKRVTTRDGAPSDFTLRGDGVELNLMKEGVLQAMVDVAMQPFDNDVDRVLGVFCMCMNPSVARHLSFGHHLMTGAGPLSVMRGYFAGAGGNCGYHSRVFTGMMNRVTIAGRPVTAHTIGVMGHVVTAFRWKGSKVIMDADVGHIMLKPDGSDFATLEDFRGNPDVLTTASPGEIGRYFPYSHQHVRDYPGGDETNFPGVFPPGAPRG